MKTRTKKGLIVVAIAAIVLSYYGKGQGVASMLLGFAAAIWIMNWAFNVFMPKPFVKTKKKILKKIF